MKVLLFIPLVCFFGCAEAQNESASSLEQSLEVRLSTLFEIESKHNLILSQKDEVKFFEALPNSFDEYREFFCQKHELVDGRNLTLSFDYHYGVLLSNLFYVEKRQILNKFIQTSLKAHWEADAIGGFQRQLQIIVANNVKISCELLDEMDEKSVTSFWQFYFDGPHPEQYKAGFVELNKRFKAENKKVAMLMESVFERLLENATSHGH